MNNITYEHINCKETDYIYSLLLNYYQNINNNKCVNFNYLIESISSSNNNYSYLELATLDNKIIGFIHYHLNNHYKKIEHINKCEINFLVVDYQYRNKGIATELLNRSFKVMNKLGLNNCYLDCSKEFSQEGYRFWLRYGRVIKETKERNYIISNIEIENIKKKILKNQTIL